MSVVTFLSWFDMMVTFLVPVRVALRSLARCLARSVWPCCCFGLEAKGRLDSTDLGMMSLLNFRSLRLICLYNESLLRGTGTAFSNRSWPTVFSTGTPAPIDSASGSAGSSYPSSSSTSSPASMRRWRSASSFLRRRSSLRFSLSVGAAIGLSRSSDVIGLKNFFGVTGTHVRQNTMSLLRILSSKVARNAPWRSDTAFLIIPRMPLTVRIAAPS
mmetsp:Transcript_8000/g.25430  ORF Transcript_8000/g.25430 Transcript_8000/m.25430 type:complete len:215 (+) Transcript_8000:1452-2096(+)